MEEVSPSPDSRPLFPVGRALSRPRPPSPVSDPRLTQFRPILNPTIIVRPAVTCR